jgi:hypothetical protein
VSGIHTVDSLDERSNAEVLAARTDLILGAVDSLGDLLVGETLLLGLVHELLLDAVKAANGFEFVSSVNNVLDLVEEPFVDLGEFVDAVNRVAFVEHGLTNSQPSTVGGVCQNIVEIVKLVALDTEVLGVNLTDSLLE